MVHGTGVGTQPNKRGSTLVPAFVLVAAVAAALLGAVLAVLTLADRSPEVVVVTPGQEARAGGLALQINAAEWVSHQMMPGMPPSSMPGMPAEGERRLYIPLTLRNPSDGPRSFGPADFRLHSSSGASWSPLEGNLRAGTLGPGQALNGSLFFDVPEAESGVYLLWTKGGTQVQMPLGDAPEHDHD